MVSVQCVSFNYNIISIHVSDFYEIMKINILIHIYVIKNEVSHRCFFKAMKCLKIHCTLFF